MRKQLCTSVLGSGTEDWTKLVSPGSMLLGFGFMALTVRRHPSAAIKVLVPKPSVEGLDPGVLPR
jgi:hypothetical protein